MDHRCGEWFPAPLSRGSHGRNDSGLGLTPGADYDVNDVNDVNDNFFLRVDVRKLGFDTEVTVETPGNAGNAQGDPLVQGIRAGFSFQAASGLPGQGRPPGRPSFFQPSRAARWAFIVARP